MADLLDALFSTPAAFTRRIQAVASPNSEGFAEALANPDAVLAKDRIDAMRERYRPQFDAYEEATAAGRFEDATRALDPVARGLAESNQDPSVLAPYYQRAARGMLRAGTDPARAVGVEASSSRKLSDFVDSAKAQGAIGADAAKGRRYDAQADATHAWRQQALPADVQAKRALASERGAHAGLYGQQATTEAATRPYEVDRLEATADNQRESAGRARSGAALADARTRRLDQAQQAKAVPVDKLLAGRAKLVGSILPGITPADRQAIQDQIDAYDSLLEQAGTTIGKRPPAPVPTQSPAQGNVAIPGPIQGGIAPAPQPPQAAAPTQPQAPARPRVKASQLVAQLMAQGMSRDEAIATIRAQVQ